MSSSEENEKVLEINEENTKIQLRKGKFLFPNGDEYEGDFMMTSQGRVSRCGSGTHKSHDGMTYTGQWLNDKMEGKGEIRFPNGNVFTGSFKQNAFNGSGSYQWNGSSSCSGCVFHGEFVDNKLDGLGVFTDDKGQDWTGNFYGNAAPGLRFSLKM